MKMSWFFLFCAIVFELIATTLMKASVGFSRWLPTLGTFLGYFISFTCLSFCLKKMDVSLAYAIWSAAGTIVISIIGVCLFGEHLNALKIVSILFIVVGVVGLNLSGMAH